MLQSDGKTHKDFLDFHLAESYENGIFVDQVIDSQQFCIIHSHSMAKNIGL